MSSVSYSGNNMIVNLTNVSDQQVLKLATMGGGVTSEVVPIGFLAGDVNASRTVNAGDAIQTRANSGQTANPTNFRTDVNVSGNIDAGDAILVRARSGNGL